MPPTRLPSRLSSCVQRRLTWFKRRRNKGGCRGAKRSRPDRFGILRDILKNLRNDMVSGDAFGFGFEIQNQPMAHGRGSDGLEVVEADVEPALGQRAHLAGEEQGLSAARAAAETE